MTFLPIVERELREGARRTSVRRVRLIVAALALLIGLYQVGFNFSTHSGHRGFLVMTGFAFVLCLMAGVFVTADCLSEEKREGTLGLLFLTDLKGYDVILGKLTSQLILLGYALMALIPAAALPLLLGGVTGGEVLRVSLALMNLLFFSLAAGMLASTVCRNSGAAMMTTAVLLIAFCGAVPLFQGGVNSGAQKPDLLGLNIVCPAYAYARAIETSFVRAPDNYWWSLGGSQLVGWMFIFFASRVLPHSWQEGRENLLAPPPAEITIAPAQPATAVPAQVTDLAGNNYMRPTSRRRVLLDDNPWLWLIGERDTVQAIMIVLTAIYGVLTLVLSFAGTEAGMFALAFGTWTYLFVTKILFAFQACRFFQETRRAGAFEMLLATPLPIEGAQGLVSSQWAMLRRTFGATLLAVAGVVVAAFFIILLGQLFRSESRQASDFISVVFLGGGVGGLMQALDFFAIGHLGMWLALTMRKPQFAPGLTILCVLLLPFIGLSCVFFISPVLDLILIAVYSAKLRSELRGVLTGDRTQPGPPPAPPAEIVD